jgi:manganese transport protein
VKPSPVGRREKWRIPASYPATAAAGFTARSIGAGRQALSGRRRGLSAVVPFVGPAVIASVAYMDPGNFATNIQGGASYGYNLLWVVVFANLVAMLFQALSARLGIVSGKNLAEMCRLHLPTPLVYPMWIASEIGAIATDLAELLGAGIGFQLLFHISLLAGTLLAGAATCAMLRLQRYGFRAIEALVALLVVIIGASYLTETVLARPDLGQIAYHSVVPWLGDSDSVLLAVGIIGATVMPHVIYLHSSLTQNRIVPLRLGDVAKLVRFSNLDVVIALGVAGLVNIAMMYMAAAVLHDGVHNGVADMESAYHTLGPLLGRAASSVFLISLLASGLSSSMVGTMAGDVIMQGFVGWRIPLWVRRAVTMAPTIVVVALGVNTMQALIMSQAILSLVLPIPMLSLVAFTSRRSIMGEMVNGRLASWVAIAAAGAVLALNVVLLLEYIHVPLPLAA